MKQFLIAFGLIFLLACPGFSADPLKPLSFPFELQGGTEKSIVTQTLTNLHLNRDNFDQDETAWGMPHKFHFKTFKPDGMILRYRDSKLMQVNLVQQDILECADMENNFFDALEFVQSQYVIHPENVHKAAHFGTNNCLFYMKPGNVGWEAVEGDYAVNIDSHWRDMKYSVYVTYTYLPLYKQKP